METKTYCYHESRCSDCDKVFNIRFMLRLPPENRLCECGNYLYYSFNVAVIKVIETSIQEKYLFFWTRKKIIKTEKSFLKWHIKKP